MEELPPPAAATAIDDALAERLARLSARRSPTAPPAHASWTTEGSNSSTDADRLADRLAALAARRSVPGSAPGSGSGTATSRTRARPKRHHPAHGARVAALGLSLASTGGLAALFAVTNGRAGTELQVASVVSGPSVNPAGTPTASAPTAGATPASPTPPSGDLGGVPELNASTATPATNTVVDGGVFHNKWGDVQVQVTFGADGTLLDVTTLQTPYRDGKSVRINDAAVPRLNAEALTAQSADVDTVSGATYTSNDYHRSLQSAIDAAAQAGIPVAGS